MNVEHFPLTGFEETPTSGLRAVPARRRWPALVRRWMTGGRSWPVACWSSWRSWNPRRPAWVQKTNCYSLWRRQRALKSKKGGRGGRGSVIKPDLQPNWEWLNKANKNDSAKRWDLIGFCCTSSCFRKCVKKVISVSIVSWKIPTPGN